VLDMHGEEFESSEAESTQFYGSLYSISMSLERREELRERGSLESERHVSIIARSGRPKLHLYVECCH
jgi:hypothetical protein